MRPCSRHPLLATFLCASLIFSTHLSVAASPTLASCTVQSGTDKARVIELYTSEGCSSCPPADRWLSGFVGKASSSLIPLAFHVDYWDAIGWKDRFASEKFTARQYAHMRNLQATFVYTPQLLVNGKNSPALRQTHTSGNLIPTDKEAAEAELNMQAESRADGSLWVEVESKRKAPHHEKPAVAYIALFENGLVSDVRKGENAGQQLRHDFVVREWIGPFNLGDAASVKFSHHFAKPEVFPENAGIAAIVELADGSRLLQAVAMPWCKKSP